jgi:hypothetical protein
MRYPHHIVTRGSGGTDNPDNLINLCLKHHDEVHTKGTETFAEEYGLEKRWQKARRLHEQTTASGE